MMKHIVIMGCARSGKSFLSKNICRKLSQTGETVCLLPGDVLLGNVHRFYKNIFWKMGGRKIVHAIPWLERLHARNLHKRFINFTTKFISSLEKDVVVVLEGTHIKPEEAVKIFSPDKYKLIIVGYPKADVSEKLSYIKKHDKDSYLKNKTDKELEQIIAAMIAESKSDLVFAKKHGIKYIDTSKNYQKNIKTFAENIQSFMEE